MSNFFKSEIVFLILDFLFMFMLSTLSFTSAFISIVFLILELDSVVALCSMIVAVSSAFLIYNHLQIMSMYDT